MITQELEFIRNEISALFDFEFNHKIETIDVEGVYAKLQGNTLYIGTQSKSCYARALTLAAKAISEGKTEFEIVQNAHFKTCGALIDMSRNGVMTVSALKKYMLYMLSMGFNMLMLYMEDVYELEKYPYFGYVRGRYTVAELKEIDDFAYEIGIEVIPCIQTLGHMEQYLKWSAADEIRDTANVMLAENEKTFELIDEMIKTMKNAFRTDRIHIGMDEAWSLGTGVYLQKNGYHKKIDIFMKHLKKVCEICEKYDLKPMVWSDMIYQYMSKTGSRYTGDIDFSQEFLDSVPNSDFCYWDYFTTDENKYREILSSHKRLGRNLIFAGGNWTWCGLLPNRDYTDKPMYTALKACLETGVDEVLATMWNDDGAETNYFFGLPGLALFSEHCYLGDNCTKEDVVSMAEFVTGISDDVYDAFANLHRPLMQGDWRIDLSMPCMGKRLFYTDILYNLTGSVEFYKTNGNLYEEALGKIHEAMLKKDKWYDFYYYAVKIFEILAIKKDIIINFKKAYLSGNTQYLQNLADNILPELITKFEKYDEANEKLWRTTFKMFGFDVLSARIGVVINRTKYAQKTILKYLNGEINKIEELEFDFIDAPKQTHHHFVDVTSTSLIR